MVSAIEVVQTDSKSETCLGVFPGGISIDTMQMHLQKAKELHDALNAKNGKNISCFEIRYQYPTLMFRAK